MFERRNIGSCFVVLNMVAICVELFAVWISCIIRAEDEKPDSAFHFFNQGIGGIMKCKVSEGHAM